MTAPALDGRSLTLDTVAQVARRPGTAVTCTEEAVKAVARSREVKWSLVRSGQPVYGVTTGFGDSVSRGVPAEEADRLQRHLIRYHLNGTGPAAPEEVVRATLLVRANCLARGHSAVQPRVLEQLLGMLRHDVLPVVPERGSVGASGDLVPLCYVAAAMMGEGEVGGGPGGGTREAASALADAGLRPVELEAKDGLALINGTSFSAAYAVLAAHDARRLSGVADVCTALADEALLGNRGHFDPFLHAQRPHPGQVESAALLERLLCGSGLAVPHGQVVARSTPVPGSADEGGRPLRHSIQDRYSLRCAPQVNGVLRDTLAWASEWLEREVNASTDNPLFDADTGTVHSGGNFYGGHVAQAMDGLKTAVANVADLLDRQVELLVDERYNQGLTANLAPRAPDEGMPHHGFKGMQIACSALTAEALKTSTPAGVFSRSTEAHNQDKVSMATVAARDARTVVELAHEVAAIHLLTACQALDLRGTDAMSPSTRALHALVREVVPPAGANPRMDRDIAEVVRLIRSGALEAAAD